MTLVLSCLTRDYVLQVSDRRLVFTQPKFSIKDDDTLKAVLLNGHVTFAYTGLSELPRSPRVAEIRGDGPKILPTNMWLAEVLSLGDCLENCLDMVAIEAKSALNYYRRYPENVRRLGFIGVGWTTQTPESSFEPMMFLIDNFDNVSHFKKRIFNLGDNVQHFFFSSLRLSKKIYKEKARAIAECVKRGLGPGAIGRVLIETLRKEARYNKTVGTGAILTCIPRANVEIAHRGQAWGMSAGPPSLENMTFLHIPAGSDDGIAHGPTAVMGDAVIGQISLPIGSMLNILIEAQSVEPNLSE